MAKKQEKQEVKEVEYKPEKLVGQWGENISNYLNQKLRVTKVEFYDGLFGKVAVFTLANGKKVYTSSKVIVKQAEEVKKMCEEGNIVIVTPHRVKRYLTL